MAYALEFCDREHCLRFCGGPRCTSIIGILYTWRNTNIHIEFQIFIQSFIVDREIHIYFKCISEKSSSAEWMLWRHAANLLGCARAMLRCDSNKAVYGLIGVTLSHSCSPGDYLHTFRAAFCGTTYGAIPPAFTVGTPMKGCFQNFEILCEHLII